MSCERRCPRRGPNERELGAPDLSTNMEWGHFSVAASLCKHATLRNFRPYKDRGRTQTLLTDRGLYRQTSRRRQRRSQAAKADTEGRSRAVHTPRRPAHGPGRPPLGLLERRERTEQARQYQGGLRASRSRRYRPRARSYPIAFRGAARETEHPRVMFTQRDERETSSRAQ